MIAAMVEARGSVAGIYQNMKPTTNKNIGKNLLKDGRKTYHGSGAKEAARAAKRLSNA